MKQFIITLAFLLSATATAGVQTTMACAPLQFQTGVEKREKIALIDTGVSYDRESAPYICKDSISMVGDSSDISDAIGHGTNIAGIISRAINPDKQCLLVVRWFSKADGGTPRTEIEGVIYAVNHGAKIINMSLSGAVAIKWEFEVMKWALSHGSIIDVSAGNEHADMDKSCDSFPACYADKLNSKNFHVVGSKNYDGKRSSFSNYGKMVDQIEIGSTVDGWGYVMSGTSQATAVYTAKLLRTLRLK